jgi:hypothetical protein
LKILGHPDVDEGIFGKYCPNQMSAEEYEGAYWANRMSVEQYSVEYRIIGMWLEEYSVGNWSAGIQRSNFKPETEKRRAKTTVVLALCSVLAERV